MGSGKSFRNTSDWKHLFPIGYMVRTPSNSTTDPASLQMKQVKLFDVDLDEIVILAYKLKGMTTPI
jgi:hypothetical protein